MPAACGDLGSRRSHRRHLRGSTTVAHYEAGLESVIYSASSFMRTAVESADDACSMALAAAPWTSHFFAKPVQPAKAAPVPEDEVLRTPVLDDESINLDCFRDLARGDSLTSLGHDADTEDFFAPPAAPRSAPAHASAFQPSGFRRSFSALRPSGTSSSSGVSVATESRLGLVEPTRTLKNTADLHDCAYTTATTATGASNTTSQRAQERDEVALGPDLVRAGQDGRPSAPLDRRHDSVSDGCNRGFHAHVASNVSIHHVFLIYMWPLLRLGHRRRRGTNASTAADASKAMIKPSSSLHAATCG
jgi:hypothetical protein